MEKTSKIYVAGHRGLVGSSIVRILKQKGYTNIVYRTSKELDVRDKFAVDGFFAEEKPEFVFLAAAKVGGIVANNEYPADFIRDNLLIQTNVIDAAYQNSVRKTSIPRKYLHLSKISTTAIKGRVFINW